MIKVLELFGGIGACSKAFERLKIPFEIVDYVEIDKYIGDIIVIILFLLYIITTIIALCSCIASGKSDDDE